MLIHTVQAGDTVSSIARRYGVSVQRILADNGLTASSVLAVGQALIITLPAVTYTVRRGDSLYSIAAGFGTSVAELQQNNPDLALNTTVYPGQIITISFRGEKIRTITTGGFAYPHVSRPVLRSALPFMTYLCIFSYGFTAAGSLIEPEDRELISLALADRAAPVLVLTTITEDGGFSSEKARLLLENVSLQNMVLENLAAVMDAKGYRGLDIDFEYVPQELAGEYLGFLGNARGYMERAGFFLSTDLAPKTYAGQPGLLYEAHDYPAIGGIADRVLLMTYEWGYTYGPPMAVAPLPQVRAVVNYAVSAIPRDKILMGIPNYGYNWTLPFQQGVSKAQNVGNEGAVRLAGQRGAEIRFDSTAQSPFFEYTLAGARHVVWFEDVRSIQAKLALADEFGLSGVGYWNLMRPFAQSWAYLAARYGIKKVL